MTGGDRGLPQGPAFARYLAEVFLLELDSLCGGFFDEGAVHHSRFVDDIVLIFEPESVGASVSGRAMDRIGKYLRTLGLDVNPAKTFHGTVSDFRAPFRAYRQEAKYIIDQTSRRYRAMPRATVDTAVKRLLNVIGTDGTTAPKTEQLSFFYSHLTEYPPIAALQLKLEADLLKDPVGRGSVFSRVFEHQINRLIADDSETLPDAFSSLTGLRREAFLNAILAVAVIPGLPEHAPKLTEHAVGQLRPVLDGYKANASSALEHYLLLLLMLVDSRLADASFLATAAMNDCFLAVSASLQKSVPKSWSDRMLSELERIPFSDHVHLAYDLLFESQCDPGLESSICRLFINRSLTAIGRDAPGYRHEMFSSTFRSAETSELSEKYHQLICFAPLVGATNSWNPQQLASLWTNAVGSWQTLNEHPRWNPLWLRRAAKQEKLANVNTLILGGIRQNILVRQLDYGRIFKSYYEVLILCILGPGSRLLDSFSQREIKDALTNASNKSSFLRWILTSDIDTIPWPNKDECVENVVRNDLMVLFRNGELMVRFPSGWPVPSFEHLPDLRLEPDGIDSAYKCAFYSLTKGEFDEVEKILEPATDLIEFSRRALEVRNRVQDFSSRHFSHNKRFVNVFAAMTRLRRGSWEPQAPFSGLGEFLVFSGSNGCEALPNTAESFDTKIWRWIVESDLRLLNKVHALEVMSKDIDTALVPFKTVATRLETLRNFVERVPKGSTDPGNPGTDGVGEVCRTLLGSRQTPNRGYRWSSKPGAS